MRVIQMLPSISYGDGVGNDCLAIQKVLLNAGYDAEIYAGHIGRGVKTENLYHVEKMGKVEADDIIIYHLSTGNNMNFLFGDMKGKKILRYHNITPGYFFRSYSSRYQKECDYGRAGLRYLRDKVDFCMTDSNYNGAELMNAGYKCPVVTIPIVIPFSEYEKEADSRIVQKYSDGRRNFIFTGRLAPNKCQEDIIKSFYLYKRYYDREARLFLVGSWYGMEAYYDRLKRYVKELNLSDVYFTGHVPFEHILAYYKIADAFICMSEHEGFCIPLVEAMYFGVPIVAYNSSAVGETLGEGGILLEEKSCLVVAACLDKLCSDGILYKNVTKAQRKQLEKFCSIKTKDAFLEIIGELSRKSFET